MSAQDEAIRIAEADKQRAEQAKRAAEQALDKFVSFARVVLVCRLNHAPRSCRYEKTCAE